MMFVPIESALTLALDSNPDLFQHALDNRVGLVTPNLVNIALRTIENFWRVDRQNQNAQEIADQAGKLYDKFVGFIDAMLQVGTRLGQAKDEHDQAMRRLSTGKNNLIGKVERLKKLGVGPAKSLPSQLVEGSDDSTIAH
ncbi:MAG: DNA recombination protein RmuC [Gammaproteobacteria bacterium]|nr:DNA recombination protein RmuC [Gammaproteobacteria bacterium]MBT7876443.1 DNA recombination protein RmuC [Gammaproteobacteria bacterium]